MGAAPRTIAVAVAVEDRLQFFLQQHRRRSLRHPVSRISHARANARLPHDLSVSPRPAPARESNSPSSSCSTACTGCPAAARCEQADADRVHARRPVIGPDLLPRLHDEALTDLKRLHLRLGPGPRLLPWRVGPGLTLVCTAPSLQPHYRTFPATTSRPAPVPRLGTLPLTVFAARGPPSRGQPGWIAVHADRHYRGDRFSCSVPAPATSSRHLYTGHRQGSTQAAPWLRARHPARLCPGRLCTSPGFDAIVPPIDASAVVHARSSSRRTPDPLTAGLFPQRSPPRLLTGAACGGLGSPPARRTRRTYLHHWHSTVRAGDLLHRLTPLSGRTAERRFTCVMQLIRRRRSVTCERRHCAAPVGGGHRPARPPGDRWFCPTVGICLPGSGRPRRTL